MTNVEKIVEMLTDWASAIDGFYNQQCGYPVEPKIIAQQIDALGGWVSVDELKEPCWFVFENPNHYDIKPPFMIGQYWGQDKSKLNGIDRVIVISDKPSGSE